MTTCVDSFIDVVVDGKLIIEKPSQVELYIVLWHLVDSTVLAQPGFEVIDKAALIDRNVDR